MIPVGGAKRKCGRFRPTSLLFPRRMPLCRASIRFSRSPAVVLVVWQRPQLFSLRSMGLRPAGPPACQPEDRDVRRDARARCTETHTGSATENKERKTRNKLKSSLPTRLPADRKPFSSSPKTFHLLSSHHKQLGEKSS